MRKSTLTGIVSLFLSLVIFAQEKQEYVYNGLKFRNIGPAITSGRISDIAIDPCDEDIWYIATGAAGVWKTQNAGITWTPVFEHQKSYSIGCISIDPTNSQRIWVGTGENNGGRHVGFGDGVYMSEDGGMTWKNMGLTQSEHISKIIIHPENPQVIWVAAQGPLWSSGGERGVYKSTDGGKTWKRTLQVNEWTGATDLLIDPEHPEILYAATWQRHRNVSSYIGGGPGSAIYKSTDGGEHWTKITRGLPGSNLGKIGLGLSPFDSNVLYAAVETTRRTGSFYISRNAGVSWTKQSDIVGKGTGPHYYQEIFPSPHHDGRVFFCSNYSKYTEDYGKNFQSVNEKNKHVDTHAIAFISGKPGFILFGTDGGLYETRDDMKTWRHFDNLPITQFYRIAVDDKMPFYNIYGGTQDNGTQGGPSRTIGQEGITNADWKVVLGADGCQTAVEPRNPDIVYGEFQEGAIWRIDRKTGESVFIQPQAGQDESYERFNWNAPFFVSPHNPQRLYIASQRVWKSDDRGNHWTCISPDLTRNTERFELPVMGRIQSWDNCWDYVAMSNYNTISAIAESPVQEGLLYAGTDDGMLRVSEDGGQHWSKMEWKDVKGIPQGIYVNRIVPDLFDAHTVYACLDHHKSGDFKPYLYKSTDMGKTWKSIAGDLPERLIVWSLVQDHQDKNLLFLATEFGIYFTRDGGKHWESFKDLPVIPFRDIRIQRQADDLVGGSFSRGIFILDDISPLRHFDAQKQGKARLYNIKDAWLYTPLPGKYGRGDAVFIGKNPPFGAVFTYYLPEKYKTLRQIRQENEKKAGEKDIPFPGWDALEKEAHEDAPMVILTVKDEQGRLVRRLTGSAAKGFNRANWNLDREDTSVEFLYWRGWGQQNGSTRLFVQPGTYTVSLGLYYRGEYRELDGPREFQVRRLLQASLPPATPEEISAFTRKYMDFKRDYTIFQRGLKKDLKKIDAMKRAWMKTENTADSLMSDISKVREELLAIQRRMDDYETKNSMEEHPRPSPKMALNIARGTLTNGLQGPLPYHIKVLDEGIEALNKIRSQWENLHRGKMEEISRKLTEAGAPVIVE